MGKLPLCLFPNWSQFPLRRKETAPHLIQKTIKEIINEAETLRQELKEHSAPFLPGLSAFSLQKFL